MERYDHTKIEGKWQKRWEELGMYRAREDAPGEKFYLLDMFPYPSGDGLHVGHVESYTATDIVARYLRMQGKNVLHPMGWDAFGLPAENYAIKSKVHPNETTAKAIDNFRRQIKSIGLSYDWTREIGTHTPEYYRWTQWFFLLLYENGLAYKKLAKVNWCESCKTVLANEQVIMGQCERCKNEVIQKDLEQWFFKITEFAEDLLNDLDTIDWPESTKIAQRNWIGKSEGAEIEFRIKGQESFDPTEDKSGIKVFTTRPDTLFGATYLVLAPEHPLVESLAEKSENKDEAVRYIVQTKKRTELERTADTKEKTGVELTGVKAVNPATEEEIPIFIADYVLAHYGTGAIMAVPVHDERDFAFAKKFNLPVREVVVPLRIDKRNPPVAGKKSVERRNVHVIVRNPRDGKVLILKWKKHPWTTFPMGGVEDGEEILDAAAREVREETGYQNLMNGTVWGGQVRAEYFAAHKDQNRVSYTSLVTFDLVDEECLPLSAEEGAAHEVVWADMKDLTTVSMTHAEMDVWLDRLRGAPGPYTGDGVLIGSGEFNGFSSEEAKKKITDAVGGKWVTTYKLRDWLVSRQRYWGAPIPIIYCDACGMVPVPEGDLPVLLPNDVDFMPTGESPLARSKSFHDVACPACGKSARRESDTMDTFVCSSWYYYRFTDPGNTDSFASEAAIKKWLPVDLYVGGAEHTVLHLLYARFFTKVLNRLGHVAFREPFRKLRHQGLVLAEDGRKMSKSLGNVVNPDDVVKLYGADTLRLYEMFMGPLEDAKPWSTTSIIGPRRFLERVWRLALAVTDSAPRADEERVLNETVKKVGDDIVALKFNTAISQMMIFVNEVERLGSITKDSTRVFIRLLAPFAPHIADELWARLGGKKSVHTEPWPPYDAQKAARKTQVIAVQVNGKTRGAVEVSVGEDEEGVVAAALDDPAVRRAIGGGVVSRRVYVPGRVLNLIAQIP